MFFFLLSWNLTSYYFYIPLPKKSDRKQKFISGQFPCRQTVHIQHFNDIHYTTTYDIQLFNDTYTITTLKNCYRV